MERKIAPPDMISMSRSSRDNRAPKNPKFASDTTASNKSSSASKKSQIRATGTSRSATSASKKANTGGDGVAGVSGALKKPENGLSHIDKISSVPLRTVLRSKRAAETETLGDVTLDALRPVKKQKISNERGKVKGLKNDAEYEKHSAGSTDTSVAPTKASSDLGERNSDTGVSSKNIIASPPVKLSGRGVSTLQIGTRNGLPRVDKRKEQRALRPRPTATAPEVKKRTRFHEVTLGEGDGPRIVGRRIKVFWPLEEKYFYGHVKSFNGSRKLQHKIVYDDKDEEWLRLQNEVFRIELLSGEVFGGKAPAPGTEANTVTSVADNATDHSADFGESETREHADARFVEASGQGRIKPEGVYRRKRRAERASEEIGDLLEHEKKLDGEVEPKKKAKGDGELKSMLVGDDERKQLPEGRTGFKVREAVNQPRGTLAERFGRMNAKWASGNSVTRDRRKTGLQVVTSRDLRMKGLTSDSPNARRKRAAKDKGSRGSSIQTRLRHSIAAEKDGKKAQRRRIRDDDWLFASVKTSSAVIRRQVAESKKSKEGKTSGRISEDNSVSRQTRNTDKIIAAQDEILVGDLSRNVTETKGLENPPVATQGVNLVGNVSRVEFESEDVENSSVAIRGVNLVGSISRNKIEPKDVENAPLASHGVSVPGPYEAVMDIYREALSEANDESGTTEVAGIEKLSSVAVRFEGGTSAECDSRSSEDANVEILRQSFQDGPRSVEGAFVKVPQVTSGNASAAPETDEVDENGQQTANEVETNMSVRGGEEMDAGDQSGSLETVLVVPQLIPPITLLGSEFQLAPDEVYRRLNKDQPDKVYRRLKHSRIKGNNEELGEQDDLQQCELATDSMSASHVDNVEAALSPLVTVSEEREEGDTSSREVGAYYGEPSLQSFLRVAGADVGEMTRGEIRLRGSALTARNLMTNASVRAAESGSRPLTWVGLFGSESRNDELPSSLLIFGDDGVARNLRSFFMDSSAISILAAYFRLSIRDYGGFFPRLCSCRNCLRLKAASPVYVLATRDLGESRDPKVAACKGFGLCTGSQITRSVPEAVSTYRAEGPGSEQEVGQHYGPPSVESILRVSKEFWLWLLVGRWKARQSVNVLPAAPVVPIVEDARAPPPSQCPELSSFETVDDDDLSDQDDRMQVMSSTRREADDSYVGSPDPGVVGDEVQPGLKPIKSVLSVKKGRRTGKGFKRGFVQMSNYSFQKDSLGFDSIPDGDDSGGRPDYKRTRVETESTGGACNRVNGVDASPPSSSLEGKGVSAPSALLQEKTQGSTLPRVNVLKLRRCPTNNGLWLVAGNSYTASQCKVARVAGIEVDSSVSLDREPMTPNVETGKKRVLDQFLESPQRGRSDQGELNADCSSDSQERESSALGMKSAKAYSLHTKSRDVWVDCGIASVPDGLDIRKRRPKFISPTTGDDLDIFSDHSMRRAPDAGWGACIANLLVTESDRCVRETGAIVELQTGHDGSCTLLVCLHGQSKYALKPDQPIAAGTTNKFTHSMMWRGGKAWSLEFVDRKQWQLFKDLHEECFQRNARAALVRHIPIPVSKSIQEIEKLGHRFMRPPLEYIHQLDGEVETILKSSRIMYDMDSEDEDWLNQTNNEQVSARGVVRSCSRISDETLEGVIDRLERNSFIRNHAPFSAEIATELCQPLGSPDVIKAIYSYWLEKRRKKRTALIRHFQQPAPWEQYQRQMQEWQAKVDQLQHLSPTASKEALEASFKRPPLFAFCLRPRGLEGRNKMQKQRSQRKQGLGGSSSRQWTLAGPSSDFFLDSPSKRLSTFDSPCGPFNGSRKFAHQGSQEDAGSTIAVDLSESVKTLTTGRITSLGETGQGVAQRAYPPVESSSLLRYQTPASGAVVNKRSKKLGRKAKKLKSITAAEDSRLNGLNGTSTVTVASPHALETGHPLVESIPSTSGISVSKCEEEEEDDDVIIARSLAADAFAKRKRESASSLRSRAQALYAVADAAMHEAVAAVITADAIHAAERTVDEASVKEQGRAYNTENHRLQIGEALAIKYDTAQARGSAEATRGGSSFGSWRRALNSASKSANHVLAKGSSSKSGIIADTDDPLLPVASWSQELGAGLGTRLLQTGDVGPRQRYSPVLVEGISKSPIKGGRGDRGDGLVSLGRTRGESMMAMLTR